MPIRSTYRLNLFPLWSGTVPSLIIQIIEMGRKTPTSSIKHGFVPVGRRHFLADFREIWSNPRRYFGVARSGQETAVVSKSEHRCMGKGPEQANSRRIASTSLVLCYPRDPLFHTTMHEITTIACPPHSHPHRRSQNSL